MRTLYPEGWYGEGGGRGVQDGEHMYIHGGFMLMYAKPIQYCKVINLQLKKINLYKKDKLPLSSINDKCLHDCC